MRRVYRLGVKSSSMGGVLFRSKGNRRIMWGACSLGMRGTNRERTKGRE